MHCLLSALQQVAQTFSWAAKGTFSTARILTRKWCRASKHRIGVEGSRRCRGLSTRTPLPAPRPLPSRAPRLRGAVHFPAQRSNYGPGGKAAKGQRAAILDNSQAGSGCRLAYFIGRIRRSLFCCDPLSVGADAPRQHAASHQPGSSGEQQGQGQRCGSARGERALGGRRRRWEPAMGA